MTNSNEKNFDQKQPNSTDTAEQSKKNPIHESGQFPPKLPDPSKKDPSQADDSRSLDREALEQPEKRRA